MKMKLSNYARIFKALSNEQRLKIFMEIYQQSREKAGQKAAVASGDVGAHAMEKAFTKMCKCLSLSQSTVSHHFKELENAGLINCERSGQMYLCSINEDAIKSIKEFLKK